jgi:hypothetical protein
MYNKILKSLTVHVLKNGKESSKRLAAILREQNFSLEKVVVMFPSDEHAGVHDKELNLCKVSACGRGKLRTLDISKPDFVALLAKVHHRDDSNDSELRVASLLYGLLREKPHLRCVVQWRARSRKRGRTHL